MSLAQPKTPVVVASASGFMNEPAPVAYPLYEDVLIADSNAVSFTVGLPGETGIVVVPYQ